MGIQYKNKFKVTSTEGPATANGNGVGENNIDTTTASTTIYECVESGDHIALHRLLHLNPSLLNYTNHPMIQTPLHVAASLNGVEMVKCLLVWGGPGKVDVETKDVYGETALHIASKNGYSETARLLLNDGTNVDAKTNNAMTPLHLAVGYALRTGDNSIVKTLIDYNANCFAEDDGGLTPIEYLPEGIQVDELLELLRDSIARFVRQMQNGTQQNYSAMARVQNIVHQSNHTHGSSSGSQNGGNPGNYEIKAKMDEFDDELSKIVGLQELKHQLQEWAKGMLLDEKRKAMGHNIGLRKFPHMAFLGNPGTGKTTVAQILGRLLKSVGVLSSDKVTEVQCRDLVGEYHGQTRPKTRKKIEEAMGGILFVDEAYRLVPQQSAKDHVDYGAEAMEEIMSVMEKREVMVVFAGHKEAMNRVFWSNEEFCRQVKHFFRFDNFTCKDLAEMVLIKMKKPNEKSQVYGLKLQPACTYEAVVGVIMRNSTERLRNHMNGGMVDHMLNCARQNLDSRLTLESKEEELSTLMLQDLEAGLKVVTGPVHVKHA